MEKFQKKVFTVLSFDKSIGGISKMIELSTLAMISEVSKINLFLLKNANTTKKLTEKFKNNEKIRIYKFNYLEKLLLKTGFLKSKFYKKIILSDIIFIHNASLAKPLRRIFIEKFIILFFHTDKQKQLKSLKHVNKVFTVNNFSKSLINRSYNNKATLLANCIDVKNNQKHYERKNKKLVVGAMGRLVKKKGFDKLIRIFKQYEDISLMIAGDGPLMNYYRGLVKGHKNINLLGWVENKNIFFSKINIFFSSSEEEPFGLVILEAMTRGIPVISTKCNGPMDILKNNHNGILVEKNNIAEMKQAVFKLKDNVNLRNKIIKNALVTVKKKYSIEEYRKNLFQEIKNFYDKY